MQDIKSRKLFKIREKFKEPGEGEYSSRPCDFEGCFILQEDGTIKGYMDEKYDSPYDPLRFIYGVMDGEKLAFLKLSDEKRLVTHLSTASQMSIVRESGERLSLIT